MRGRLLDFSAIARAAGFALVAVSVATTAIRVGRHESGPRPAKTIIEPQTDPLAQENTRCDALGIAAEQDASCDTAWAENRRRFFTYRPADSGSRNAQSPNQVASKPEGR